MDSGASQASTGGGGGGARLLAYGLLTSAVATLLVLGAFEIYLRATFEAVDVGACGLRDPELVWAYKPDCGEYNAFGFRDYAYPVQKPAGAFRILLIGDSVVEGHRVGIADTFGKRLEARLNAGGGRAFEVIHLARSGYTTQQELVLLKRQAFELQPDLILWNYCLNDPLDPLYHPIGFRADRIGYRHGWYVPRVHVVSFLDQRIFLLREKIRSRNCPREYHRFYQCAYQHKVEAQVAEIAEASRERGVPILFVVHPIYHPGAFRSYLLTDLHERLTGLAQANGLPAYDLLDAYAGRDVAEVGLINPRSGKPDVW
ncbi:MAG TPA: SGNH/GDSL hydrolase family protein, partial [Myxococcota bacterium]